MSSPHTFPQLLSRPVSPPARYRPPQPWQGMRMHCGQVNPQGKLICLICVIGSDRSSIRHHVLSVQSPCSAPSCNLIFLGGLPKKKTFFFWEISPKSVYPPTHPRVFVRFGSTKGEIRVKKGDFRGDLGGF